MLRLCKEMFYICFYFFIKKIYFVFFKFRILSKIKLFFENFRILPCILKLSFSYVPFFLLVTLFIPPKS